jgi:uncharacterized SAM-binding protein YcdF (DUF218 family)
MAGALGVVAVFAVAGLAWLGVFAWLGREDALEPCPVTVVLNGDHPGRAEEAATLYRQQLTQRIWLTNDPRSGGIDADAGTTSNVRLLVSRGVPTPAIHIVEGVASGTGAELQLVRAAAERDRPGCLIAVTSPAHASRVKVLWWRQTGRSWPRDAAGEPRLVIRHARDARYAGWWIETRELAGTLSVLLGVAR